MANVVDLIWFNCSHIWKRKSIVNGQNVYILAGFRKFTNDESYIAVEFGVGAAEREFKRVIDGRTPKITGNGDIGPLIWAYNQMKELCIISDTIKLPIVVDAENDCPRRLKVYRRLEKLGFHYNPRLKIIWYEKDSSPIC